MVETSKKLTIMFVLQHVTNVKKLQFSCSTKHETAAHTLQYPYVRPAFEIIF